MLIPRSEESELAYTSRKIEANISNFSAWHQRSKIITSLGDSALVSSPQAREEGELLCFDLLAFRVLISSKSSNF